MFCYNTDSFQFYNSELCLANEHKVHYMKLLFIKINSEEPYTINSLV